MNACPDMARIVARQDLTRDTVLFAIAPGERLAHDLLGFTPGQFVQLSWPGGGEIPISLAGADPARGVIELCIRRVGHVTALVHGAGNGAPVGLRGPFGKGFPVEVMTGNDILLLAGGLGIAPFRSLLLHLVKQRASFGSITLMYGAREPSTIMFRQELLRLAAEYDIHVMLTVDFVTGSDADSMSCRIGLLPSLLNGIRFAPEKTAAAICGPPALYRCTIQPLLAAGCAPDRIFVSLERRMQCGQGICSHCAVGDRLCCTDGPVFSYAELAAIPEAL